MYIYIYIFEGFIFQSQVASQCMVLCNWFVFFDTPVSIINYEFEVRSELQNSPEAEPNC